MDVADKGGGGLSDVSRGVLKHPPQKALFKNGMYNVLTKKKKKTNKSYCLKRCWID